VNLRVEAESKLKYQHDYNETVKEVAKLKKNVEKLEK
jgi:hypothetical protein